MLEGRQFTLGAGAGLESVFSCGKSLAAGFARADWGQRQAFGFLGACKCFLFRLRDSFEVENYQIRSRILLIMYKVFLN